MRNLSLFAGWLPPRALGLVIEWATLHRDELLDDWDKAVLSIGTLFDDKDDKIYWRSLSPLERLGGLELNRRIVYGYGDSSPRFQRLLEIAQRERR
jgi:hypothetical protein